MTLNPETEQPVQPQEKPLEAVSTCKTCKKGLAAAEYTDPKGRVFKTCNPCRLMNRDRLRVRLANLTDEQKAKSAEVRRERRRILREVKGNETPKAEPASIEMQTCECGIAVRKVSYQAHLKSLKHGLRMNTLPAFVTCECGYPISLKSQKRHLGSKNHATLLALKQAVQEKSPETQKVQEPTINADTVASETL